MRKKLIQKELARKEEKPEDADEWTDCETV